MAQSITDIMSQIRGGYALNEAGKKLQELVSAVRATGKKGKVCLTIEVEPDKTDERIIKMKPSIQAKIPEKGFSEGIMFVGPDGRLTREDPAQLELLAERDRDNVRSMARSEAALEQVGRGPAS
jgi:hypothetical protein